jgi:hypothetical protein
MKFDTTFYIEHRHTEYKIPSSYKAETNSAAFVAGNLRRDGSMTFYEVYEACNVKQLVCMTVHIIQKPCLCRKMGFSLHGDLCWVNQEGAPRDDRHWAFQQFRCWEKLSKAPFGHEGQIFSVRLPYSKLFDIYASISQNMLMCYRNILQIRASLCAGAISIPTNRIGNKKKATRSRRVPDRREGTRNLLLAHAAEQMGAEEPHRTWEAG